MMFGGAGGMWVVPVDAVGRGMSGCGAPGASPSGEGEGPSSDRRTFSVMLVQWGWWWSPEGFRDRTSLAERDTSVA